ncbi:MAG: ABC transporter ATP-binding protein [Acidimicrobiales bacterium]
MGQLLLDGVTKRYGEVLAVDHLDLDVADGELLVLLGPSGCGKTTALRLVAGLEELDEGTIAIAGQTVNDVEPRHRDIAMVFQTYALYPHLTVARNIEFPLRQRGIEREERLRRVNEVAVTLGLDPYLARKPGQLSGGQRQRVALARAIVRQPAAFLMDEPLSNLDAALRVQTRADIVALQERLGTTTLYVTHDQVEAMTMGHRIAVLDHGVLQQVAAPQSLYDRPGNTFVAGFLGSPGMNLFNGELDGDRSAVRVAGGTVPLPSTLVALAGRAPTLTVGARPEALTLDPAGTLEATVVIVEALGAEAHVICRLADSSRLVVRQEAARPRPDIAEGVRVAVDPDGVHLFDGETGRRLEPVP